MMEINGRYILKNNHYFFYNGGSGFSFKMKGSDFIISFYARPKDGYYYVIIDRDYDSKTKVYTDKPYQCSFKENKEHLVDIVKANEANDNVFELVEFKVNGILLEYDHKYSFKTRVYGDSTVAGFGILDKSGVASVHNCDSVRDFCYHALYELNMKMDILSASGYGLTFSIYTCPQNIGIIDFVDKVAVNSHTTWNDDEKYDILLISLGTNDDSYIQENKGQEKENVQKFIKKYQSLIDHELKQNPEIKILMIYGTLKEERLYYLYEQTYKELKPLYKNLYIHKFNGDDSAISNHAYVTAHDLMAEELESVIKTILK